MKAKPFAGDALATESKVIEVRVAELRQLFNSIDPSPFRDRDLDPQPEEIIVDQYFKARAASSRRHLREVFRRGRISLLIALAFLGVSLTLSDLIRDVSDSGFAAVLREGFVMLGWVAMWRPLEVFLYDWWPIHAEIRLLERLGEMPVRIEYEEKKAADAWRSDWPLQVPGWKPRPHAGNGTWIRKRTCDAVVSSDPRSAADPFDELRRNAICDYRDSQDAVIVQHLPRAVPRVVNGWVDLP